VRRLDIGQATDVGRVRESNEDALLAADLGSAVLAAVADGMGGHAAGEVASALAIKVLRDTFDDTPGRSGEALRASIEAANEAVWEASLSQPRLEGMGTTLVAATVDAEGRTTIGNVGDSRAYVVDGPAARLVTHDHTWVAQQVALGALDEREAQRHPYRNILIRALGTADEVQVDLFDDIAVGPGEALLLVSDGVTSHLEASDLAALLDRATSAQEAAESIVRQAVERGGSDNATAVVVWHRPANGTGGGDPSAG
jgi:protein phosphatase